MINDKQKQMIRDAIKSQRDRGNHVIPGLWGIDPVDGTWITGLPEGSCMCPMSCLIVGSRVVTPGADRFSYDGHAGDAALKLGCTLMNIKEFISGFDGGENGGRGHTDWYLFGRQLREEHYAGGF